MANIVFHQVKVDAKTKSLLDEHKRKKRCADKVEKKDSEAKDEEEGETKGSDDDDDDDGVDDCALQEDQVAKTALTDIMQEFADDLTKDPPGGYCRYLLTDITLFLLCLYW